MSSSRYHEGQRSRALRVAIIQPWIPQYRVAFFEELIKRGHAAGIEIRIFHGSPSPSMAARADSVKTPWATELPTKFWTVRGRTLNWKSLRLIRISGPYDLVIAEQALKNLETYLIKLFRCTRQTAFWGHGKTYTESPSIWTEWLKALLTRRGDWFFAYTPGGAKAVTRIGFPADRITILNNSIDTAGLRRDIASVDDPMIAAFKTENRLTDKTALYLGALDEGKRIPWLIEAAKTAHDSCPDFRLLIAGDGRDRPMVEAAAAENDWIVYGGPMFGLAKAVALASSEIILMPGRVGLTAVDSFAAETPVVTTNWQLHAPEFEYLSNGENAVITADDATEYGEAIVCLLNDKALLDILRNGCRLASRRYSVENMAENFIDGLRCRVIG